MRNAARYGIGMLALGLVVVAIASTTFAKAIVILDTTDDNPCIIEAGDWSGNVDLETTNLHYVKTPKGNIKLTCIFDIPEGLEPDSAVIKTGFDCVVPVEFDGNGDPTAFITTDDTQSVSTPGGRVILMCTFRN